MSLFSLAALAAALAMSALRRSRIIPLRCFVILHSNFSCIAVKNCFTVTVDLSSVSPNMTSVAAINSCFLGAALGVVVVVFFVGLLLLLVFEPPTVVTKIDSLLSAEYGVRGLRSRMDRRGVDRFSFSLTSLPFATWSSSVGDSSASTFS